MSKLNTKEILKHRKLMVFCEWQHSESKTGHVRSYVTQPCSYKKEYSEPRKWMCCFAQSNGLSQRSESENTRFVYTATSPIVIWHKVNLLCVLRSPL